MRSTDIRMSKRSCPPALTFSKSDKHVIDGFRAAAALLVVAIHVSPLSSWSDTADFVLTRVAARTAVPFFLMVSGYFLSAAIMSGDRGRVWAQCRKILLIYTLAAALYIPLNIYAGYFNNPDIGSFIKDILWDGTFYHLWYLPAAATGLLLVFGLVRLTGLKGAMAIAALLYVIGLGGDSYYGIVTMNRPAAAFYSGVFSLFDYTRNGFFYAPLFITMGAALAGEKSGGTGKNAAAFLLSLAALTGEAMLLRHFGVQRHDSMYILLPVCMLFLLRLLLAADGGGSKPLRDISLLIYIVHPWVIVLVRGGARALGLWEPLVENGLVNYIAVCAGSVAISAAIVRISARLHTGGRSRKARAWAEVDLNAVCHNAGVFQSLLPGGCELMAVVKASAYGHGDVAVGRALNRVGVKNFAVATPDEGIRLRKGGVRGNILVLGYASPDYVPLLKRHRLTQTAADSAHARALAAQSAQGGRGRLHVHIAVDTGMHRLGIPHDRTEDIAGVYGRKSLAVDGIFTHLSLADDLSALAVQYTKRQISDFFALTSKLEAGGIDTGKKHVQATYGALNYPGLPCGYARVGIGLYGTPGGTASGMFVASEAELRPALSVRARVTSVRSVRAGESVGYDMQFVAERDMRIATIGIGYADGIPRCLSERDGYVLIGGKRARVTGRICMDQMMADVTEIESAAPGDIVTLIGRDGGEEIRCAALAKTCGTIANDILSGLGNRLARIYNQTN